jgi:hypothetical protein
MTVCRVLPLVATLVAVPFAAGAQFGGMPGLPGGTPGGVPGVGGFGAPSERPPACQQLLALRDELQKHGMAIQKANERKASVQEACRLFKLFLSAEVKFVNSLEENRQACGVPAEAIKQATEGHAKAGQVGKQVCDAAAQGPRSNYWAPGGYWLPDDRLPESDAAGSSRPPAALPPACRELLALREETHRHEQAIQRATEHRAPVYEACRLLREGVAVQTRFLKGLEEHSGTCGTPADELKMVKERHAWALWIGSQCGRSGDMRLPGEGFYKR